MPIFVVQEHHARNLHWDFRLEIGRVLKSWAIPKQPPRTKGIKRLAIQVEDHLKSYANFEGEIPEGQYGAGKVKIWDSGEYDLLYKGKDKLEDKNTPRAYPETFFKKMFTRGKIEFELFGKKLKGKYVLVKTNYGNKPKKSWLFFRT